MGTYYIVVNEAKREYLHPHKFSSGLKLPEFINGDLPKALILALNGRWNNDRIRLVSDFEEMELYELARENFTDVSDEFIECLKEV